MRLMPDVTPFLIGTFIGGAIGMYLQKFIFDREPEPEPPVVFCRCPLVDKRFDSKDLDDCA